MQFDYRENQSPKFMSFVLLTQNLPHRKAFRQFTLKVEFFDSIFGAIHFVNRFVHQFSLLSSPIKNPVGLRFDFAYFTLFDSVGKKLVLVNFHMNTNLFYRDCIIIAISTWKIIVKRVSIACSSYRANIVGNSQSKPGESKARNKIFLVFKFLEQFFTIVYSFTNADSASVILFMITFAQLAFSVTLHPR